MVQGKRRIAFPLHGTLKFYLTSTVYYDDMYRESCLSEKRIVLNKDKRTEINEIFY